MRSEYTLLAKNRESTAIPVFEEGAGYKGNKETVVQTGSDYSPGFITAYDMHTGKIAWTDKLEHICYDGDLDTSGGVLFTPDWEGEMVAYNASTGAKLWSFEMGAGEARRRHSNGTARSTSWTTLAATTRHSGSRR